jgi:hypothetical protein
VIKRRKAQLRHPKASSNQPIECATLRELFRVSLEISPSKDEAAKAWERLVVLYRGIGDVLGGSNAFINAAKETTPPYGEISAIANWLNNSTDVVQGMELSARSHVFSPLIHMMESRINEASATDLSRLAWMYLHGGDANRALEIADRGLEMEAGHVHCQRLVAKLREV